MSVQLSGSVHVALNVLNNTTSSEHYYQRLLRSIGGIVVAP